MLPKIAFRSSDMKPRVLIASLTAILAGSPVFAETARHVTVDAGTDGSAQTFNVITADDLGNLRFETYAAAGDAAASIVPGRLQHKMIFQASDERLLMFDGGQCEEVSAMSAGGMGEVRQQMAEARAEMEAMLEEMREQDPAMARMMEEQMEARLGGAMMMGEPPVARVVEKTGDTRRIGDYDTEAFEIRKEGSSAAESTVWAADIDAVDGGFIVNNAMIGMFELFRDMMDQAGIGDLFASGMGADVIEKMENYYAVEAEHDEGTTRLVSAETGVPADFFPACN